MQHALQLAARLRRAAREGKQMKDGRTLDANVVDDALDVLLDNSARLRTETAADSAIGDESEDEETEEQDTPPITVSSGPDNEEAFEDEDFPEMYQDQGDFDAFQDEPLEDEFEDEYAEYAKYAATDPGAEDANGIKAPKKWVGAQETEEAAAAQRAEVPQELWEQVICRKFNVVDRVWKSPTSATLPKVPSLSEDSMVPESAWLRLPHIAVNGMTNCGKSTLINHILRWTYAAKASSVPGRTKSIDFYCINNRFVLVDLPGYPDPEELAHQGVLKKWEAHWQDLVLTYLQMCAEGQYDLRLMLQLQATQRRPSRACRRFVQELKDKDLPLLLVLTKDDQLKKPNEERNYYATQIKKTLGMEGQHLHFTAKGKLEMSRRSKKHLQRWIRTAVTAKDAAEVKQIMQEAWQSRRISETVKTPEEKQAKKERWKAHYKALREEKKKKAEEERKRAEAEEAEETEEESPESTESTKEKAGKARKLRIRIPRKPQKTPTKIDA